MTKNTSTAHILIVDDETDIRSLLGEILEDEGYRTSEAAHSEAALHIMSKDTPDLIILDIWLDNSDMDGMEILAHVKQTYPDIPVLMISGHGNIEMAVKAMKLGAYEFIEKPFNSDHLLLLLQRALETHKLRSENTGLKKKIGHYFENFTATDPASVAIKNTVEKIAPTQSRVMISGATGSGKTLLCHMIHGLSMVSAGPLVFLECATLSSDQQSDRQGTKILEALDEAANGSLVLQNVHNLSIHAQTLMIDLLQNSKSTKAVRIISTTDHNVLDGLIAGNQFKQDLFYRLNIVNLNLPCLIDRKQDISELSQGFLKRYFEQKGKQTPQLSSQALMLLMSYDWPGNIRQLKNIMENVAMTVLSDGASIIETTHIPADIKQVKTTKKNVADQNQNVQNYDDPVLLEWLTLPMKEARQRFEKHYLDFQMNRFSGQISKVASFIEMERTALHRKLKSLDELSQAEEEASIDNQDAPIKQAKG